MTEQGPDVSEELSRNKAIDKPTPLSSIRGWLDQSGISDNDQSFVPDILKEIISILQINKQSIANCIRTDTGKSERAALNEISRSISAIQSAVDSVVHETIGTGHVGFGKMQFLSGSMRIGSSVIIPDMSVPVLSLIEKLVPSIMTRKQALVFLTDTTSITLNRLFGDFFINIRGFPAYLVRDPEIRSMRWYISRYHPLNILFSGSTDLFQKIQRLSGTVPFSAESQFGYSVFASQGSDLDRLAETLAVVFQDRSLAKFLRPADIIVLADNAEYLRNRIITELEKTVEPWVVYNQPQAETFASFLTKRKMSEIDIHFWKGYESGIFSPALISPVSKQSDSLSTEIDLPVLSMHEVKSLEDALALQAKSQNRMYSSVWTSDADLIQHEISSVKTSLLTVNGFPTGTEESITNLAVNSLPVRWVRSLTQFMSTNFSGLLYS